MKIKYLYFRCKDNTVVDSDKLIQTARIVNDEKISITDYTRIREYAKKCKGILDEIFPTVYDMVAEGKTFTATMMYHRKHPNLSLQKCKEYIDVLKYQYDKEMEEKIKGLN